MHDDHPTAAAAFESTAPERATPEPTVAELSAEVDRLRCLVEDLTARLDAPTADPVGSPLSVPPPAPQVDAAAGIEGTAPEVVGRRGALKRAGALAAGAVAGGAGLVAATASPAAAAQFFGSGNPGVSGTGVGGDGVQGTTDTASKSGVYGSTATANAYGVFARHTGNGTAIGASAGGNKPTATVESTGASTALAVTALGTAAQFTGGVGASTVKVFHNGVDPAADVLSQGSGYAVRAHGTGTNGGLLVEDVSLGAAISATNGALRLTTEQVHLEFITQTVDGDVAPADRGVTSYAGQVVYSSGALWYCVADGTPGTWQKLAGPGTAGALHVLPAPIRAYDSRVGTLPSVGPKTKLAANVARVVDLTTGGAVPVGATAAMVTLLLVNTSAGNGNATVWANGVARPSANTMVWGGSTGRFAITATTAVDSAAKVQVLSSLGTDVVIDVVGYYR